MRRVLLLLALAGCRNKQEPIARLTETRTDAAADVDAETTRRPDARLILDPHKVAAYGVRREQIVAALEDAGIALVAPPRPDPDELFLVLPAGIALEKVGKLEVDRLRDAPVQIRDIATLEVMMGGY